MAKHAIEKPKKNKITIQKPQKAYQVNERAPRDREEMSRSAKGAIILLSVLVLITAATMIAWERFTVKEVVIYGLETFNYADVVKLTGLESNQNIFLVDLKAVEDRIENNPNIDVVNVKMVLPSKIEVTVSERIPTAMLKVLGQYLLLDENAYVLGVGDIPKGNYPEIEGLAVTGYETGHIVSTDQEDKLSDLQELLISLKKKSCAHMISHIDISDNNNIILMGGDDIQIKIGSVTNIEQKCAWIHDMVPSLKQSEERGILHITDKNTAHFVPGSIENGNTEEGN